MDIIIHVFILWNINLLFGEFYVNGYKAVGIQPKFDVPAANMSVTEGQAALLPCSIDNLGEHEVVWLDDDFNPLTYGERRIVHDSRFNIQRPFFEEWNLQIDDVKWEDQGTYRCTINTKPVSSKIVMLHVKVPAKILDEYSSNDMIVEEGETVILVCNVTGVPKPNVTWQRRRAHGSLFGEPESKKCKFRYGPEIGSSGEMVIIQNITRYCDYIYECVADNNVGDTGTSRSMRVTVEFPPEINLPNRYLWQYLGKETYLVCTVYAYPQAQSYWMKDGAPLKTSTSTRISVETYFEEYSGVTLSLRIEKLLPEDYGTYSCVAKNKLGSAKEDMELKLMEKSVTPTTRITPVILTPKTRIDNPETLWTGLIDEGHAAEQPNVKSLRSSTSSYNSIGTLCGLIVIIHTIFNMLML